VVASNPIEKPFDPDDLPLEAERVYEEPEVQAGAHPRTHETVATAESDPADHDASRRQHGRPFRIRLPGRGHDSR
jgi:hypothetical protein